MRTARDGPTPLLCRNSHDLANHLLISSARNDPLRALGADTGDLTQATRLLLDDVEYGFAEGAHQLFRIDRANAPDHAGTKIFLDALDGGRCRGLEKRRSELNAVRTVVDPGTLRRRSSRHGRRE